MPKAQRKAPAAPPLSPEAEAFGRWAKDHNEGLADWLGRLERWASPIVAEYASLVAGDAARVREMLAAQAVGRSFNDAATVPPGTALLRLRGPVARLILHHAAEIRSAADPMAAARAGFELGHAAQRLEVLAANAVADARMSGKHAGTVFLHGHAIHVTKKLAAWFGVFQGDRTEIGTAELVRQTLGRLDHHEAKGELREIRDAANRHLRTHGVPLQVVADDANGVHYVQELRPTAGNESRT